MSSTLVPVVQKTTEGVFLPQRPSSFIKWLLGAAAPCFRGFGRFQVAQDGFFRSHHVRESHDQRKRTFVI